MRLAPVLALVLVAGCAPTTEPQHPTLSTAMGWRFGPGFSCKDPKLFRACPRVVQRGGDWYLRWTYGSDTFYYSPGYQARDRGLVFSLQATSSSGHPSGRLAELRIQDADAIKALERDGAVWWEPDGSYVSLGVTHE